MSIKIHQKVMEGWRQSSAMSGIDYAAALTMAVVAASKEMSFDMLAMKLWSHSRRTAFYWLKKLEDIKAYKLLSPVRQSKASLHLCYKLQSSLEST